MSVEEKPNLEHLIDQPVSDAADNPLASEEALRRIVGRRDRIGLERLAALALVLLVAGGFGVAAIRHWDDQNGTTYAAQSLGASAEQSTRDGKSIGVGPTEGHSNKNGSETNTSGRPNGALANLTTTSPARLFVRQSDGYVLRAYERSVTASLDNDKSSDCSSRAFLNVQFSDEFVASSDDITLGKADENSMLSVLRFESVGNSEGSPGVLIVGHVDASVATVRVTINGGADEMHPQNGWFVLARHIKDNDYSGRIDVLDNQGISVTNSSITLIGPKFSPVRSAKCPEVFRDR